MSDPSSNPFMETPEQEIGGLRAALDEERNRHRALRGAIADALVPLLRAYAEMSDLPEAFSASVVEATGLKGGNHSHGGALCISFATGQGDNYVACEEDPDRNERRAVLTARGDWEQAGLVDALAELLAKLLPIYRQVD